MENISPNSKPQKPKGIAILGSTGSIGTQALDVIRAHRDKFSVELLTSNNNVDLLIAQAKEFNPNAVIIVSEEGYKAVSETLQPLGIKVFCKPQSLADMVEMDSIDLVLTALVGYAGLKPTMAAISSGKHIALANKETLVVAGGLITKMAQEKGVNILPVDSEHSAIFQCLAGEWHNPIEKIYLSASGGPFRGKTLEFLASVTREQALKHPNWEMGAKITIDSATLMNKGLEMIEAQWLFNLKPSQIDVVVHPQSIIHSVVQFCDGSMKAQMGLPDMRLPIQYALAYPQRMASDFPRFNFASYPALTFEAPDTKTFRNLALAKSAMEMGGNAPCVLNAANEIAVEAFLKNQIPFLKIPVVVENCLEKMNFIPMPGYSEFVETDFQTRKLAGEMI